MKHDERIDAYIARQADFARPILEHLRSTVHAACPEAEETLKWGAPSFMYKGKILGLMAAFKAHAVFNLWQGSQVVKEGRDDAMGQFGRIASIDDLPQEAELHNLIRKAKQLVDEGAKPVRNKTVKAEIEMPDDLRSALDANPQAAATYEAFSPSCRREYLQWVTEAKQAATREKRVAQAVEWMAEGKKRNWKYEKC